MGQQIFPTALANVLFPATNFVDGFLNRITMYKLVLYYLILLVAAAAFMGVLGVFSINPAYLLISSLFLAGVCYITNIVFARVFRVQANVESSHITALILALIVTPAASFGGFAVLFWVGVLAISSKYILAWRGKHLFNPAAVSVTVTSFALGQSASWWVGTLPMLPFVLLGVFIVFKIRRFNLVFYYLLLVVVTISFFTFMRGEDVFGTLREALLYSPVFFFAFVMLAEPSTTPSVGKFQSLYGAMVGFLFAPQVHFGSFYTTPETALVLGNLFSYFVSPKERLLLKLKEKSKVGSDIWDFVFSGKRKFSFLPGQYLEWTLGHANVDSRGNRRHFTIASSPTEPEMLLGVKFYNPPSSFKKTLLGLAVGDEISASQLAGDFTLPEDKSAKLVFMAGGIGITPFRSMIKYMLDRQERRDVVLIYSSKETGDIVYKEIFDDAKRRQGLKAVYTLTGQDAPADWQGERGYVNSKMIMKEVPDWRQRIFYISGPRSMVVGFEKVLRSMGVLKQNIKTDYFPGYV